MSKTIHFTKMHGIGNDYIYVDTALNDIKDPAEASRIWSDRHCGIGGDGLVLIGRDKADFTMRIFNADGSEAMMCGNASRCIGKYLYERGLTDKTTIRLLTLSGIKVLRLHLHDGKVATVTVDMLEPVLDNPRQFDKAADPGIGTFVSMGNPHYVVFTDDIGKVATEGPLLEYHAAFPERCNIEFVQVARDGSLRTRVWERGSGITQACGTGACATAVAAALTGRSPRRAEVVMDGGRLSIEWSQADNHVYMTGSAEFVFDGEIEL